MFHAIFFKKKQDSISSDFQPIRTSLEVQAPVSIAEVLAARTGENDKYMCMVRCSNAG